MLSYLCMFYHPSVTSSYVDIYNLLVPQCLSDIVPHIHRYLLHTGSHGPDDV